MPTRQTRSGHRLKPNADACYKLAIQLAPDLQEPYERSFLMLCERKRFAQAVTAGKRLLKRFPNHAQVLESMAELCQTRGGPLAALEFAQRAVDANPLDARLRKLLAEAIRSGLAPCRVGNLADAAADLAEAMRLRDGRPDVGLLGSRRCRISGRRSRAAEGHVRAAWTIAPAAAAYSLAIEAARLKLPKPLKQRFDTEFAATLVAAPTGPAAVALAAAFQDQSRHGSYAGQKAHEKKVQAFVEAAVASNPSEAHLACLGELLRDLDWLRLLKKVASRGQSRFHKNPFFPFFEATVRVHELRVRPGGVEDRTTLGESSPARCGSNSGRVRSKIALRSRRNGAAVRGASGPADAERVVRYLRRGLKSCDDRSVSCSGTPARCR